MSKMNKYQTQILIDVEVSYDFLPAQQNLPNQVDIQQVVVQSIGHKGNVRKINIVGALDESALINLEDDVLEHHDL